MATIPAGTRFLGVDPSLTNLTEKKGSKVDRKTEYFSLEDLQENISSGGTPSYVGALSQEGTSNPTVVLYSNTSDYPNLSFSRSGEGGYVSTLSELYTGGKVRVTIDNGIAFGDVKAIYDSGSNTITVVSFSSGVPSDDVLVNAVIKVEYY